MATPYKTLLVSHSLQTTDQIKYLLIEVFKTTNTAIISRTTISRTNRLILNILIDKFSNNKTTSSIYFKTKT